MTKSLIFSRLGRSLTLLTLLMLGACGDKHADPLKTGPWRGVISMQGQELPFNFTVDSTANGLTATLRNAEEQLLLDEVRMDGDTVVMVMHIFDAELRGKVEGDSLNGFFVKNYEKNYRLPFRAAAGQEFRFSNADAQPSTDFTGRWATTFFNDSDTTIAVGIFKQTGNAVTGTFLTPTGDYRYLEGNVVNGIMNLSVLDGNHAFLFTAEKTSDQNLTGTYRSGKAWMQTWTAVRDDKAALPDANALTALKDGIDTFQFSFPDEDSTLVDSKDTRFSGKPMIIQLLGTWCPNCMDETKFLSGWYNNNKNRGIEVVGLAFE
ncbi:MAG: TlpA disulfide reductase family protein, partial [Bacteroidota bacterium]